MRDILDGYKKKKEYLVCFDSDGCAMDTMDMKHICCFGPCMVREWGLEPWEDRVLKQWNEVNLYSMTRGINRFKGLELVLKEADHSCKEIKGLDDLSRWIHFAQELSEHSLERWVEEAGEETPGGGIPGNEITGSEMLYKVLHWSREVNRCVGTLPEADKKPFHGVLEAISSIHTRADIVVVSSANQEAILEEWRSHGLLEYTDLVLSQNAGSKAYCIGCLLDKGYKADKVLMVGDAPGDRDAAASNQVLYFPVLAGHEKESWERLVNEGMNYFTQGNFHGEYQKMLVKEFERNLSGSGTGKS